MSLLVAAAIVAALSLVGYAFLQWAGRAAAIDAPHARLRIPLSLSAGTLLTGWLMWIAGTLFSTTAALAVAALLGIVSLPLLRPWARDCRRVLRELAALVRASPFAGALLLLPMAIALPQLLVPLVDSDGLRYHAAFAKLFLLQGRVTYYPWDLTGAFPQSAEMIYMAALRAGGGETIKLVHFLFFLATLATLSLVVHRRRRDRTAAVLAPLLLASSPVVLAPAPAAFIDHVALFHIAVAFLVLWRGAVPLAAAFATKYTTAPAIAVLGGRRGRPLLIAAVAIVLAFAPFAIRNTLQTGDPIYPIGHVLTRTPLEGVPAGSLQYATQFHSRVQGVVGIPWTPGPDTQPDEVAGLHHLLGLFALLLAVRQPRLRRAAVLVIVYLGVAAIYRLPARYMLPMFFALALLEAAALAYVPRRLASLLTLGLCAPALLWSAQCLFTTSAPFVYVRGRADREHYLAMVLPGYRAAQAVNALPPGGRVMALDFPVPYYFDRPWVVEGVLHEPPLKQWLPEARSANDLLARLHGLDIRLLVVTPGYGGATPDALLPLASNAREAHIVAQLRQRLRLRAAADGCGIFEVPPR